MVTQNQAVNNDRPGTFQEKTVPAEARLAGWAWLVQSFGVRAPVRRPSAVSDQHVKASSREAVRRCFRGDLKPPFNREARAAAGFPARYWEPLAARLDK